MQRVEDVCHPINTVASALVVTHIFFMVVQTV